eukprot:c15036_g1_i1.p1 GENE.c15036_g1_i1~~c15036_g1_i1.p1  ORF type:complete len:922 (-),score=205.75 c15036_g1_i1:653-3418(-)
MCKSALILCSLISIENKDDNKVFGVTFRTPVGNSKGIPHILEHSVLCGSRKYPTKEPFVDLLKGSLQTFLNAFTYPDRTCYPVASQNLKDFYNLVDVYMNAVWYPRALTDSRILAQEGWHLELEEHSNPLTYKGVVFNEMKGVYSQPLSRLDRIVYQNLFPNNTYQHDSGGDPEDITKLSFEEFTQFHAKFYHPGNSRIFFYGNDDVQKRLDIVQSYLKDFGAPIVSPSESSVSYQKLLSQPKSLVVPYPSEDGKWLTQVAWVIHDTPLSHKQRLAWGILDHLLLGTPSAALYRVLTDSGIGESVIGGGLGDDLLQTTFAVGLKGVSSEADCIETEKLIRKCLQSIVDSGFEKSAIEASMNSVEFSLREFNMGSFPNGLAIMLDCLKDWNYDADPMSGLGFEAPLAEIKQDIQNGVAIFENMISELLNNRHHVHVTLRPDPEMEIRLAKEEEDALAAIKQSLSTDEIQNIIEATHELKKFQQEPDSPEAQATIPRLGLEDLDRKIKTVEFEIEKHSKDSVEIVSHNLPTSGILYADVAIEIDNLSFDQLRLLPLFTRLVTESGTSNLTATELDRLIHSRTGGVSVSTHFSSKSCSSPEYVPTVSSSSDLQAYLLVRGKSTAANVRDLFEIFSIILSDSNFTGQRERVIEILKETKAMFESRAVGSGHKLAQGQIQSRLSLAGFIGNEMGGLAYFNFVKHLLEQLQTDAGWSQLLGELFALRISILESLGGGKTSRINLTGDKAKVLSVARPYATEFALRNQQSHDAGVCGVNRIGEWDAIWRDTNFGRIPEPEALLVPTQVNYVAKGCRVFHAGDKVSSALWVLENALQNGFLWEKVPSKSKFQTSPMICQPLNYILCLLLADVTICAVHFSKITLNFHLHSHNAFAKYPPSRLSSKARRLHMLARSTTQPFTQMVESWAR